MVACVYLLHKCKCYNSRHSPGSTAPFLRRVRAPPRANRREGVGEGRHAHNVTVLHWRNTNTRFERGSWFTALPPTMARGTLTKSCCDASGGWAGRVRGWGGEWVMRRVFALFARRAAHSKRRATMPCVTSCKQTRFETTVHCCKPPPLPPPPPL